MKHLMFILTIALALAVVPALALAHCGSCAMDDKSVGPRSWRQSMTMVTTRIIPVMTIRHGRRRRHARSRQQGRKRSQGDGGDEGRAGGDGQDGDETTHHFMVSFTEEKSAKAIDNGTVAVKITGPDGTVTGPMELMGMQGHFGADVILDKKGEYTFQVGSKLTDGQTRQYEFKASIK